MNLHHAADALRACDEAIRFKRLVRGVASRHGMEATFMPKPYADMAGSGAHIHVSLLDETGTNVFASDDAAGSETLHHAIGGLAATMADAMLIFAPTANSYRRYRSEAYVPLNPTWAVNNRGVALRIPVSTPENRRIEHRVAGADANPYLLTAAVLAGNASWHHTAISIPGAPLTGNAYRDAVPTLPITWPEAALAFERSDFMREYFGEKFQRLFVTTRRGELHAFESHVTTLEYEWYVTTSEHAVTVSGERDANDAAQSALTRRPPSTSSLTMPASSHIASYYAASANPRRRIPRLQGDIEADVCVIGGGIAGCSTALHLAERGYRVVLLEGKAHWLGCIRAQRRPGDRRATPAASRN